MTARFASIPLTAQGIGFESEFSKKQGRGICENGLVRYWRLCKEIVPSRKSAALLLALSEDVMPRSKEGMPMTSVVGKQLGALGVLAAMLSLGASASSAPQEAAKAEVIPDLAAIGFGWFPIGD